MSGVDHTINYKEDNVAEKVKEITHGENVDVVFESIGKATWNTSLAILRPYGRVVIAGTTSGAVASQDLSDVYYYQQTILGARMGTKEEFEKVLQLVNEGRVKPIIDTTFPLEKAAEAVERMKESKQMGKIVLEVNS